LTIIGDGVKRRELESLASTLGVSERVVFLGYRKDLHSYIGASDIFLLTSEYEGFPNVVLEANACGVGVVAFNSIGGISEIIENGVNGFLVPYGDIDGLANRVKMVERGHFNSEKIREITTKRYSIDLIIKKYEDILKG
jgi:glycosyltransferase involved in cell wall biosynthesis